MNGLSSDGFRKRELDGRLEPIAIQPLGVGLLLEPDDLAARVEPEDPHRRRVLRRDRLGGNRDVGPPLDVLLDHRRVVHAVQVVAGEDQVVLRVVIDEMPRRLSDRVGRALEPVRVVGRLLRREDLDEPAGEHVHPVRLGDVPVERCRIELGQHVDPPDVGVQAVADRHVDQPVLARDRHGRLGAEMSEGKQAGAASAPEDECEDVFHAV